MDQAFSQTTKSAMLILSGRALNNRELVQTNKLRLVVSLLVSKET